MPKIDLMALILSASSGDVEAQVKIGKLYYEAGQYEQAWQYYQQAANQNDIRSQLELVRLSICYKKNYQLAGEWLSKVFNSPTFSLNRSVLETCSEDALSILSIQNLKIETDQGYQQLIHLFQKVYRKTQCDYDTQFKSYVSTGLNDDRGKFWPLEEKIACFLIDIRDTNIQPQTAYLAIELYDRVFRESYEYKDKSTAPKWNIINKLASVAAPVIENELDNLMQELSNYNIAQRLNDYRVIESDIQEKREKVKWLAYYNEKCALVYLNWHIKGDHHCNTPSADELQKIAKRFPVLAPMMINHTPNNFVLTPILQLLALKPSDDLQSINSKFGDYDKYSTKLYYMTIEESLSSLTENLVIAMNLLNHPNGIEILRKRSLFYKLPLFHLEICQLFLENKQYINNENLFLDAVEQHLPNLDLTYANLFIDLNINPRMEFRAFLNDIYSKLLIIHPSLYDKIVVKLEKVSVWIDLNKHKHLIKNQKEFWEVFTGDKFKFLLSYFTGVRLYVLSNPEIIPFIKNTDLILLMDSPDWHLVKPLLEQCKARFAKDELMQILTKIAEYGAKSSYVWLHRFSFVDFLFENINVSEMLEISKKVSLLAYFILTENVNYPFSFAEQKEFAKLNIDAAKFFLEILENTTDENVTAEKIAEWCLEIATTFPVLSYEYGIICLDLEDTTTAYNILSKVPENHPHYQDAKYQIANISFCVSNNNNSTSSSAEIYRNLNLDLTTNPMLAQLSHPDTKTVSCEQIKSAYLQFKQQKNSSKEIKSVYKRATSPIFTDAGRYGVLKAYVSNDNNKDNDFCKILKSKFGDDFFEENNTVSKKI